MGDLSDINAAQSVKIIGSNSTGVEQTPVNSDSNGNLLSKDYSDGTPGSAVPPVASQVAGSDGTNLRPLSTDNTGKININNISGTVSLPTGASTAANQSTGNTSLSSIDTKLTTTNASLATIDAGIPAALGETTKSASMPVVQASDYVWKEAFVTSTPLGISGVYNSGVIAMNGYNTFELNINADQQSAVNNILVIFYEDALGTKIVDINFYDYLGTAVPEQIIIPVQGNYLVVQYTNGTTAQGSFVLQGILKNSNQQATATTLYHKEGFLQQISHLYLHTKNYNTGRLPEVRKRISVEFFAQGVTSGSTLRTNNAGFTFYLETLIISVVNTNTTIGSFALQDGTDTTDRIPFTIEPAVTLANRGKLFETIHFGDDPKPFGSDVRTIFTAGTLTVSIYCKGYEEIT